MIKYYRRLVMDMLMDILTYKSPDSSLFICISNLASGDDTAQQVCLTVLYNFVRITC